MPIFRLVPCVAVALFAAMLLTSCGGKEPESKKEGTSAPEVAPTPAPTPAPASPSSTSSRPEQADASPAGSTDATPAAPSPATEEEKTTASSAALELMKARRTSLRRSALAEEKLASRSRALEKSDDPVIQAAVKLVNDRQLALAAAKAAVEAAESSLAQARKELEKVYATDSVWAESKAEVEAMQKEESDLTVRLQTELAKAHKRGFHLKPPAPEPEAVPAPAPEATPAPAPETAPAPAPEPAPASPSPVSSSSLPEQAGASPAIPPAP